MDTKRNYFYFRLINQLTLEKSDRLFRNIFNFLVTDNKDIVLAIFLVYSEDIDSRSIIQIKQELLSSTIAEKNQHYSKLSLADSPRTLSNKLDVHFMYECNNNLKSKIINGFCKYYFNTYKKDTLFVNSSSEDLTNCFIEAGFSLIDTQKIQVSVTNSIQSDLLVFHKQ